MLNISNIIAWVNALIIVIGGLPLTGQSSIITIDQIHEIDELGVDTHIKDIEKDHNGFFWVAADNGLYKYDGELSKLPGFKFVKAIEASVNGNLWVISDDGLFSINSEGFGFVLDTLISAKPSVSNTTLCYPKSLYEDKNGIVWIGENEQVVKYEKDQIKRFALPFVHFSGYLRSSFFFMEDGFDRLWCITFKGGLQYFDRIADTFVHIELPIQLDEVSCIVSMGDDRIRVGAASGVFELKVNEAAELISFNKLADIQNVSQIEILENTSLIGTWQNGLFQMDDRGSFNLVESFKYTDIIDIKSDDKTIWIATNSDILVVNKIPFTVPAVNFNKRIPSVRLLKDNSVLINEGWNISQSRPNYKGDYQEMIFESNKEFWINDVLLVNEILWMVTSEGVFKYSTATKSLTEIIDIQWEQWEQWLSDIVQDNAGNIWISSRSGRAVIEISPDNKIRRWEQLKNCQFIIEDPYGRLFAAGNEGTLFVQSSPEEFYQVHLDFPNQTLPVIWDAAFWKDSIYLATDDGVFAFNRNDLAQNRITPQLLTSESCISIAVDNKGVIWFADPSGLKRLYKGEFDDFDRSSGLPSREIVERGLLVDNSNNLWCATSKGVAKLKGSTLMFHSSYKPKIAGLKLNNENIDIISSSLGTFFSNSRIEMNLTTLSFPASKVNYRTTLRIDNKIIEQYETGPSISLFGLTPATYQLELRAKQPGFKWSDPVFYTIVIKTQWYRTPWFTILTSLLLFGLLFLAFTRYNKNLRRSKLKLEEIVKERTEKLNQQNTELIDHQKEIIANQKELIEKNKVIKEAQEALTASEIQFLELKREQMQLDLDLKSKQLTSQTLSIIRKNQQLLDLSDALKNLVSGNDVKEISKNSQKLSQHIKNLLNQDDHWEEFRLCFEQVHTDFYSKLKISHPNLTHNDLKQCALVKLNLSLEDSATLVGVSSESIRISRYRIQKKMRLNSQNAFSEYLLKL